MEVVNLEVTPGIYPPGGWKFTDAEGQQFEASSLRDLVHNVWSYRRHSRRPIGNPYAEVTESLCKQHPSLCREVSAVVRDFVAEVTKRAIEWLKLKEHGKLALVARPQAQVRAMNCLLCPQRAKFLASCEACDQNLRDILKVSVEPQEPFEQLIGCACLAGEDDLSVAVWVDGDKKIKNAPESCWRKL